MKQKTLKKISMVLAATVELYYRTVCSGGGRSKRTYLQ